MPITLKVSSHHGQYMGSDATKVFEAGGSIGRVADNDWVLPDPERVVSGHHATVMQSGDGYVLTDQRSTNGTFVNGAELPKGGQVRLKPGDEIGIGEYRLMVALEAVAAAQPPASTQDGLLGQSTPASALGEDGGDVLDLLDPAPVRTPQPANPQAADTHAEDEFFKLSDPVADPVSHPNPVPAPGDSAREEVADDWWNPQSSGGSTPGDDPFEPEPQKAPEPPPVVEPTKPSPVSRAVSAPVSDSHQLSALLSGAGIDPAQVNEEVLESLGQVVRIVVEGMIEVLRARADIKDEFRVPMTRLKAAGNNPLKLATTTDDALKKLFVDLDSGYQDPVHAFEEGFEDLKNHQLAMLDGMRAGYRAIMQNFDPDKLEKSFDTGLMRASMLEVVNKTKYWDLYRKKFDALGDEEQSFRRLFGDEFAKAYEEQMAALNAARPRR